MAKSLNMKKPMRKAQRLTKHFNTLKMLKHPNHKVRNTIIQTTEDPVITCICECVANLLYGCVPVNTKEKKELANHALIMRKLVKRNIRVADKRKILKQSGGFLPALLGPILGIASGLIADLF